MTALLPKGREDTDAQPPRLATGEGPVNQEQPMPQVPCSMKRLHQVVDELASAITNLEHCLMSALNPGSTTSANAKGPGPADIRAPLADEIHNAGSAIVDQYQRIHELTSRLEL